jgi:hypothetical protein
MPPFAGREEMRRSASALTIVVACALGAAGCRKTLVDVPLTWESDFSKGLARAEAQNKPIVLYFGAEWDTAAKELEQQTWSDPEIRLLLGRQFVAIAIDTTDDEAAFTRTMQERFKVVGDPTVIILGSDGSTEILRFNEYVPPRVMGPVLRAALRPDAAHEARFEAAIRQRAEGARWEELRRQADLAPVTTDLIPEVP